MANAYAMGELGRALTTAVAHEDADTRRLASARVRDWVAVIDALSSGTVSVGSRTPVRGLPAWVTLEVVRGGFATGQAAAGGPLDADELERIDRLGLPSSREALFASYLTDAGLEELWTRLDDRSYSIRLPEDAVPLVAAALVRLGHRASALALLEDVRPFAGSLRFAPRSGRPSTSPPDHLHRRTAAEVEASLQACQPNPRVEAQREALSVWLPLTDRVVGFWLDYIDARDGADALAAVSLRAEYEAALRDHPRCRKYQDPKENLPILVAALGDLIDGRFDDAWQRRVQHVLRCVTAKRGTPASEATAALRAAQAQVVAQPSRGGLALVAAQRVGALQPDEGIADVPAVLAPVTPREAEAFGVAAGVPMPAFVERNVAVALSAPIEELVAQHVVTSAEVLAELLPALTATQVGSAFDDSALGAVMAATYVAFRGRRSLLLTNLEKQVQFTELPWVRAAVSANGHGVRPDEPAAVARRTAGLAIDAFPGTILPNPLISELTTLYTASGVDIPLTEELAADIFMGEFSPKFLRAAKIAGELLNGSLYARYYQIDYDEILRIGEPAPRAGARRFWHRRGPTAQPSSSDFDEICMRAAPPDLNEYSVAGNGVVIERQQVLTTHNLAALVRVGGMRPTKPWESLALDAAARAFRLLDLAQRQPRPRPTIKDAAYAWRQAVFFTTMTNRRTQREITGQIRALPHADRWPMSEVADGLARHATKGPDGVRPFLGWSVGPHWASSPKS